MKRTTKGMLLIKLSQIKLLKFTKKIFARRDLRFSFVDVILQPEAKAFELKSRTHRNENLLLWKWGITHI